jgi:hypothetical protein
MAVAGLVSERRNEDDKLNPSREQLNLNLLQAPFLPDFAMISPQLCNPFSQI